ncbi:hypothetical protein EVAR_23291_1 [Eumeta japonica]|uniref:Uncharacterized protein n=1 Tax=Eumeta variegata TaxID=151549 RepID=A0A4C1V7G5_EUMVA|nr:hypothetical protein EVAR_23291_1 [Eumeta japonica]
MKRASAVSLTRTAFAYTNTARLPTLPLLHEDSEPYFRSDPGPVVGVNSGVVGRCPGIRANLRSRLCWWSNRTGELRKSNPELVTYKTRALSTTPWGNGFARFSVSYSTPKPDVARRPPPEAAYTRQGTAKSALTLSLCTQFRRHICLFLRNDGAKFVLSASRGAGGARVPRPTHRLGHVTARSPSPRSVCECAVLSL